MLRVSGWTLSAIFAADMVGYSQLIDADEIGALEPQKTRRVELINPAIEEFHGRIFKEIGDGILVELPDSTALYISCNCQQFR